MSERNVFEALRARLVSLGLSLRAVFWLTGLLAFFLSPIADNLTTALVMGAVVMAMGASNGRFIAAACINVVVAANAGGAFAPLATSRRSWYGKKALCSSAIFSHCSWPLSLIGLFRQR